MIYVPPVVYTEIQDIKREDNLLKNIEAFNSLVKYARVGREVKRLSTLGYPWHKKTKLPDIDLFNNDMFIPLNLNQKKRKRKK